MPHSCAVQVFTLTKQNLFRSRTEGYLVPQVIDTRERNVHVQEYQRISLDPIPPSSSRSAQRPWHSMFSIVARLLGVGPATTSCFEQGKPEFPELQPPEPPTEILARRYPYMYIRSLSG